MSLALRFLSKRWSSTATQASALTKRRKFYKEVGVVDEKLNGENRYKITLDGRVLKTLAGKPLQVESEPLALAIAEEWASQDQHIEMGHMRLTGLAFTAQDNPLATTKDSITSKILEYLHGDTVLYFNDEQQKLLEAQRKFWQPVVDHANKSIGTSLVPVENMFSAAVSSDDEARFRKWILSHNHWALHGLQYAVETTKSLLIPYAVLTFQLTADEAVARTLLEQKIQADTWGSVEFAHGVEEQELIARLSAAALFVYFNSHNYITQTL